MAKILNKVKTLVSKQDRVGRTLAKAGNTLAAKSAKITKDLAKTNKIQNQNKRFLKLKTVAKSHGVEIPTSKTVKVRSEANLSKDQLLNQQITEIEKALEQRANKLFSKSDSTLNKKNKFSDKYTMTEEQRRDAKTADTGLSKIAASGAVLFGLIDPTVRASERIMNKAHKQNMEEDKQLFEYLYSPNSKEGK